MEHSCIKVYVHKDVPRLRYILNVIFCNILGADYKIVTDKDMIGEIPAINYSEEDIQGSFKMVPHDILFESDIKKHEIEIFEWEGLPAFFTTAPGSDMPFDLFAASFYLLSRYEEYLDFKPDEHGRFREEDSVAYKNGFLQRPVINLWSGKLALLLIRKFQTLAFGRNEFKALLTVDIDQAYAYRGKGFIRTTGGFVNDILTKTGNARDRARCITGKLTDPYDVYDYLTGNIEKNNTDTIFFFPVGRLSDYDKNPGFRNRTYRNLIKIISQKFRIGLHPSYISATRQDFLKDELKRIENIAGKKIEVSRQHFLKQSFPSSFRNLIKNNINEDFSLGYTREPGFRAGIAGPFRFFDLIKNEETTLTIVPFQIMDGALQHKSSDPQGAIDIVRQIINETREAGGLFVTIWHNTSLTDRGEWKGWREIFEFILKQQNL
jgi:hypothetical protein